MFCCHGISVADHTVSHCLSMFPTQRPILMVMWLLPLTLYIHITILLDMDKAEQASRADRHVWLCMLHGCVSRLLCGIRTCFTYVPGNLQSQISANLLGY